MDVWTFSTDDETPPVVVDGGLYPAPGTSNVMTTAKLEMTFNEDVKISGDFNAVIYNADWTPFEVITSATANDNVVTIDNATLMANSTYFVRVMAGSVLDLNDNEYAGITNDSWTFSTEDDSAPEIVATTPVDDATDVDPYASLMIEFKGSVFGGSEGKIELYKADGTLVESIDPTTASVSISENMATIILAELLEDETSYYIIVEPGSFTNTSSERLPLEQGIGIQEWDFTTGIGVEPAPVVTALSPDKETISDNHPTLVMTFDRNVMLGEAVSYLYVTEKDADDAHLMIEITADMITDNTVTVTYEYDEAIGGLKTDTEYSVTVDSGAITNSEGIAWEGIQDMDTWKFTTGSDFATGIEDEVVTADFRVYPNPFNDRIFISNNEKLTRIVVSNIAGQRVIDVDYPENQIRTDNLVSGIYIVSLITEDGIAKTEKIIKK